MQTGAITGYIDVAQLTLYAFWIFFAGLVYYLRREDKREGYPLISERSRSITVQGFPPIPPPKTFILGHGGVQTAPRAETALPVAAHPVAGWQGAPLIPTGNPLLDGVGPAAYVDRADVPELVFGTSETKIVPLRAAPGFSLDAEDADPRGMAVVGADNVVVGIVSDAWIDRAEFVVRYLEIAIEGVGSVLAPMPVAVIDGGQRKVRISALLAAQFAAVPKLASPDQITFREEDRISAYYGGGFLYAEPSRLGPLL